MIRKVNRFIIFVLFSFFYTLFSGKSAEAKSRLCIFPKTKEGNNLFYQGNPTDIDINQNWCADYGSRGLN